MTSTPRMYHLDPDWQPRRGRRASAASLAPQAAILDADTVRQVKAMRGRDCSLFVIARRLGLKPSTVAVVCGETVANPEKLDAGWRP